MRPFVEMAQAGYHALSKCASQVPIRQTQKFVGFSGVMNASFYVYIIQEVKASLTAPIKIGVSYDVERRLKYFQTCNSRELVLKTAFGPMTKVEAYAFELHLHRSLASYHLRGEWFSGKALSFILKQGVLPRKGVENAGTYLKVVTA